jgi:hypothetical protein
MANMQSEFPYMGGFSPDSLRPRKVQGLLTGLSADPDGYVTLFRHDISPLPKEHVVSFANLGRVRTIDHPTAHESPPFTFVDGGFELAKSPETGAYTFTIYPRLAVDFDFIQKLSPAEQVQFYSKIQTMNPRLTVKNDLEDRDAVQVRIGIGQTDKQFFEAAPKKVCPPNFTDVSAVYQESRGRYEVLAVYTQDIRRKLPQETEHYRILIHADVPVPLPAVRALFDDYASEAERNLARREDIESIANVTLYVKRYDPFAEIRAAQEQKKR